MAKPRSVLAQLQKDLPKGMLFDPMVWAYLTWLEDDWGIQRFRRTGDSFLPALPVDDLKKMESHLAIFSMPDVVDHWFGAPKPARTKIGRLARATGAIKPKVPPVFPFVRASGDGSVIAMWKQNEDAPMRYVVMGSEGEAYTLANHPLGFLAILALGYEEISDRAFLEFRPGLMADHPAVVSARGWLMKRFDIRFPVTASAGLPYKADEDPFTQYVMKASGVDVNATAAKPARSWGWKRRSR